jgi:beta-lactamase superfamily II metal-dependent hydrolase
MFTFTIFNVGHGFCAYAVTPGGANILFDCGYDDDLQFYPSTYFSDRNVSHIDNLTISHFDQDHICDIENLREVLEFQTISRNKSIPADVIRLQKRDQGGITSAMGCAIDMHASWTAPATTTPNYGGVQIRRFYNDYPEFTDMNNLSLVTFLEYEGCGIVVPGDLEGAGWKTLLKNQAFCDCLRKTNYFIASHHGRNEGYCEQIFDYCKPKLIILSDKNIVHKSQEHDYTKHASGLPDNGGGTRKVLTTRSDGHICIEKQSGKPVTVRYNLAL